MAVTIITEESTSDSLTLVVSPLSELASLLHLLADPMHHVPFGPLAQQLTDHLDGPDQGELAALSPLWTGYRARFLYPTAAKPQHGIETELDLLATLDEMVFVEMTAWAVRGGHSGSPDREQLREASGQAEVVERARSRSDDAHALALQLFADPGRLLRRLILALRRAAAAFSGELKLVATTLEVEAQRRRELAARHGVTAALAGLSAVARVTTSPERVVFDKLHRGTIDLRRTGLLAVPSVYGWPHLLVKHEPGYAPVAHYPIGPPGARRDNPPLATVRKRLAILADPSRIRLCRLIAREALSTTELSQRTGLAVPQVSRLLRPLREQNLVSVSRRGHFVLYRLDLDVMSRLGPDLLDALLR